MLFARSLTVLLGATLSLAAAAQGYPDKAVRVIVPFPPGGAADIVARHVTTRLSVVIGQQIIELVEKSIAGKGRKLTRSFQG